MRNSKLGSGENAEDAGETAADHDMDLDLPVDSTLSPRPPAGSWEDGWRLSELALRTIEGRPEIFAERDRRMCDVEFRLP